MRIVIISALILVCARLLDGSCATRWTCLTQVTVDQVGAQSSCTNSTGSLANVTCSSLEAVLSSIMDGRTVHEARGCIMLTVLQGSYVVTRRISITQNVVMCGAPTGVSVTFQLADGSQQTPDNAAPLLQQYHALRFKNASVVEISDVVFDTSNGVIAMEGVMVAMVSACSFRLFYQGALDFYDCANVTVENCTFANNGPVTIVKGDPYRGHAGGLSLGYYYIASTPPVARVAGCIFTNNTSAPPSYDQQSTSQLLQYLKFTGRGGGSSVLMSAPIDVNVIYEDCLFADNYATSYGGGLYSGYSGNHDNNLVVNRTKFVRNFTPGGGGGLELGFASGMFPNTVTSVMVLNCLFSENSAGVGGGIYVFAPGPTAGTGELSNFVHLGNTMFAGNMAEHYGAAVGMISMLTFNSRDRIRPMEIRDCTFAFNNGGLGGSVSTVYLPQVFSGHNMFLRNSGRTLVVVGTLVKIQGPCNMTFVGNDIATDGNAMYMTSLGQLQLSPGVSFDFHSNTGILGSAIAVDTNYVPLLLQQTLGNALCPFIYTDAASVPSEWSDVVMNFSDNGALVGPAVYMNALDVCSWSQTKEPWFNTSGVFQWPFISYGVNYNRAHSSTAPMWYVETPVTSLLVTTTRVEAYPGQVVSLVVKATDELGRPTASTFRIQDSAENPPFLQFIPSALTHDNLSDPYIASTVYTEGNTTLRGQKTILAEPILADRGNTGDQFQVIFLPCPPGYILSPSLLANYDVCTCNIQNDDVLACNGTRIYLQSGLWGGQCEGLEDRLATYPCPNGYCQCSRVGDKVGGGDEMSSCNVVFDSSSPNAQCVCGREGPLCGGCTNGSSSISVLLNRCEKCSPAWAAVIPVLVVLDLVAYVVIILLEKPFPAWLYPSLFYIQLLPYLTEHFPLSFNQVHPYLYYVSSGLSFYFVYDFCVYVSSSALVSYLLRYIPLLLTIMVGAVILQIKPLRNPYSGLWWIIILIYTHTVHTCMSILNCPSLPAESGVVEPVWFPSGGVHCFHGWHIPLGMVAILVLGLCVFVMPLPLLYHIRIIQHPHWLRRCVEVTWQGFKEEWRWWGSVELCRRLVVLLFIVPFPRNEYPAIFVIVIFGTVTLFVQPYKNSAHVLVELILLVNVSILVFIRMTQSIQETFQTVYFTTGSGDCHGNTLSSLAKFLAVFYYLPVLILLVSLLVWIGTLARAALQSKKQSISGTGDELLQSSMSLDMTSKEDTHLVIGYEDATCASAQYVKHVGT